MFGEEFEVLIQAMKQYDPNLSEAKIKPVLMEIELKKSNYSIDEWLTDIINDFAMFKSVVREFEFLYHEFKRIEPIFREYRVNAIYNDILNGKVSVETEVFEKRIMPYPNTEIEVLWNVSKAKDVIREERVQKSDFPFNKMDISFEELEVSHLEKAAQNRAPGILIQYEPYKDTKYEYFLLDGNHRITGKYLTKCRKKFRGLKIDFFSPIYIKSSKLEFPVYHLHSEESLKSMEHNFFQYFYLIHFLYTQVVTSTKNGDWEADNIVDNQNSRYNALKNIVI